MLDRSVVPGSWPARPLSEGPLELPCCDNVTCIGLKVSETERMRDTIVDAFEKVGFDMQLSVRLRSPVDRIGRNVLMVASEADGFPTSPGGSDHW